MRSYVEPFVQGMIAATTTEDDVTSYYDEAGELLAEANVYEGELYAITFYGKHDGANISLQQAEDIVRHVQRVFDMPQLTMTSLEQIDDSYVARLILRESVYNVDMPNTGLTVTISLAGFIEEMELHDNDVTIHYPENLVSKDEARAVLQQQPLLTLGIARAHNWQYVYKQNYDVYGVGPDGKIRLFSDDDMLADASFKPLPQVEPIDDFDSFLKGGRHADIQKSTEEHETYWHVETDDIVSIEEDVFTRACKVVNYLVGDDYENYYVEHIPALQADDETYFTFRFVYMYEGITFDFEAISISCCNMSNQLHSVTYPHIPSETFPQLKAPTVSLDEANRIAQQLVDVELTVERDIDDRKSYSFIYLIDYPTSPTKGHIQYVDAFTGDVHWVDTGWD